MKKSSGFWVIVILSVIPILLWLGVPNPGLAVINVQTLSASLGEIFGLVGIVLFSLNLILATRFQFLEHIFRGLNSIYAYHNIIGQLGLILLLFHPLLLLPRYASNAQEAIRFLFISDLWARNLGIIALWSMIILIVLTLYLRPKYNIWKYTHKFLGLAFFLGALHVYLIPSFIMSNVLLNSYILGLAIVGLVAFIYKTVLGYFLIKRYDYIVDSVKKMGDNIIEITLSPLKNAMNFTAGQFIFVSFMQDNIASESHPFSISSSPDEKTVSVTVKKLGDYTDTLFSKIGVGTVAKIEGAFGLFSYNKAQSKKQIWIAGGIGITPFLSMIQAMMHEEGYTIDLYYCVRNISEAVHLTLLESAAQKEVNNKIRIIPFYSSDYGYITAERVQEMSGDIGDSDIFICAPPTMIQALKKGFLKCGIVKRKIHSEEFTF